MDKVNVCDDCRETLKKQVRQDRAWVEAQVGPSKARKRQRYKLTFRPPPSGRLDSSPSE